jgi:hypothetical protein
MLLLMKDDRILFFLLLEDLELLRGRREIRWKGVIKSHREHSRRRVLMSCRSDAARIESLALGFHAECHRLIKWAGVSLRSKKLRSPQARRRTEALSHVDSHHNSHIRANT